MGSVTRIGVVAASSRFSKATAARLDAHVEARFPGGDVKVVFHPACFANHGHFAGDDALRARAFLEMPMTRVTTPSGSRAAAMARAGSPRRCCRG